MNASIALGDGNGANTGSDGVTRVEYSTVLTNTPIAIGTTTMLVMTKLRRRRVGVRPSPVSGSTAGNASVMRITPLWDTSRSVDFA
jgi:hypothetical protein